MKKLISTVIAAAVFCASLSFGMIQADAATIKGDVNGDNKSIPIEASTNGTTKSLFVMQRLHRKLT